jgi:type II secretory pathway pseudopilin PulG
MNREQKGFSLVEGLLVFVIVGILVGTGWYVWNSNKKTNDLMNSADKNSNISAKPVKKVEAQQEVSKSSSNEIALADNSVVLKAPASWTKDGIGCIKDSSAYSEQKYIDSTALLPGEKLRTIYGNGTEYFHINICVFANEKKLSPETWFIDAAAGGIGEGTGFPNDEKSTEPINGYSAYYRKTKPSYESVNYVLSSSNKIVYVNARIYETHPSLPGVGDFRKFESSIKDLVNTISIK